ncbi:MAG: polysaccharide biosynthesis/export family protein [Sedimenticola sp.]
MRTVFRVIINLFLLGAVFVSTPLLSAENIGYQLKPGDQLEISVWKEADLQRQVLVLPDGSISFPLVGIVDVAGKTPAELRQTITEELTDYIPDAVVTVLVTAVTGNRVYLIGKVNNPGEYVVSSPIDILQALSLADGLAKFADEKGIKVFRREGGIQKAIPFNYSEVVNGRSLETNFVLQSGDLVVVP